MSISPEDVRVELKLKHTHIIQLFDALRGDGQFCHRLLSTLAIVELINKVFELESHSLVLECKELEEALKKDRRTSHRMASNKELVNSESIYFMEYKVEIDGKRTKQRYYYFPSPMNKRNRGSRNQSRSKPKTSSMINLPDYYHWRHDEEAKKFVSRCAATKGLYFYLGHDVKFEFPSSSATASSPAATTNAAGNSQQSSTIATNTTASTASGGNPPSTPDPRRNRSSRPQRVTPRPVMQQDNIEREINNSIFEVKPVWDCRTARRLFNLPDNVDIKNEVDYLGDKLTTEISAIKCTNVRLKWSEQ